MAISVVVMARRTEGNRQKEGCHGCEVEAGCNGSATTYSPNGTATTCSFAAHGDLTRGHD
jgi:hypothetical protein